MRETAHEVNKDAHGRRREPDRSPSTMETESIGRLLFRFAFPVVAGMLITRFYILIDGMFIGQAVGSIGVAATTITMPVITLLSATVMLIGDGGTAVMALRLGAKKTGEASQVLGNALFMLIVFAVVTAVAAPFAIEPLLRLLGAEGEVLEQARIYLLITAFGVFSLGFSLGIDTFLRAAGFPSRTLFVQSAGAIVNIILDYFFVIHFGWGVAGAAWATVLGQVLCMVITLRLLFRKDMPFRLKWSDIRPSTRLILRIVTLGMPTFIVRGSDAILNLVLNALVVSYGAVAMIGGDEALAAVGAVNRISQFAMVPTIGIAVGARALIGFNYGAGHQRRVRSLVDRVIIVGGICMTALWLYIELFPQTLIAPFNFSEPTHEFAIWALRISLMAMPILMIRITGTNYFQGIGQAKKAILLTFFQQAAFLLLLLLLAPQVLPQLFNITQLASIFIAMFIADVLSTLLVAFFLFRERPKTFS